MSGSHDLGEKTRRAVLRGVGATLGVGAAAGSAAAHDWGTATDDPEVGDPDHPAEDTRGETHEAEVVGYHSLGGVGPSSQAGRPTDPHYGGVTEIRQHGDYAYVSFFSSDKQTPGRGMAIVDISAFNDADTQEDIREAELSVVSFLRNNNDGAAVMDLKVSEDGQYVFLGTQPYTALFTASEEGEAADPYPTTDGEGFTATPGGIVAVDVSDPGNPETVGSIQISATGVHNHFHHRIGGEEYIFAVHDLGDGSEGMYVVHFDRSTGSLEVVNRWRFENNNRQGEVGTNSPAYIHDVEVIDDPRTGTPTAYLSYWPRGLWALDVSDPTDIEALGQFEMNACHFATPVPELVELPDGSEKRVAIASQEISGSDYHTGRVYLVDCEGLFEADPGFDAAERTDDGVARLGELDYWEWQREETFDSDELYFGGPSLYSFSLSPHNSDVAVHETDDGDQEVWVHQAHYGGGVRFLKVTPGTDDGLVGADDRFVTPEDHPDTAEGNEPDGGELDGPLGDHHETDWRLIEEAWARPTFDTPEESRMKGLNDITPFMWGANESNGVTFCADINQGVVAVKADDVPIGGAPPVADVSRVDDGDLFTAGQTNRVDISVDYLTGAEGGDVLVRDRLPDGWSRLEVADDATVVESGASQYVQFSAAATEGDTLTYMASAPSETGSYQFGPIQISQDGGTTWRTMPATTDTAVVVGQSSELTLGTAVGAVGLAAHQRDRIADRARELLGREDA